MKTLSKLTVPALAMLLLPGAALAQSALSFYPRVGLLAPDAYFYEQYENFVSDAPTEWSTGSLGRSLLIGAGVELKLGDSGVLIRGEVARSFEGYLRVSHSVVVPRVLFNPPYISTTWLDAPYTMTVTSLQIVLPTKLTLWGAEPYVAAGVGGKLYEFGEPLLPNESEAVLPTDGFTWGGDVGAGITMPLFGNLTLDLQARDAFSKYWDKMQHDFIYSGALLWKVR
jgi:hypothetical protein